MKKHADILLEIGCEEIPAAEQDELLAGLKSGVSERLQKENLAHGTPIGYATPRRLALWIPDLQTQQDDRRVIRRGPSARIAYDKAGNPTPACLGFARSCGVSPAKLKVIKKVKKDEHGDREGYVCYEGTEKGKNTAELLPPILNDIIPHLPRRKTMRWNGGYGSPGASFTRAVRWLVLILGDTRIPWSAFGIKNDNRTFGHRAYHKNPITITTPADYEEILASTGHVIVDKQKRKERILKDAKKLASARPEKTQLYAPDGLLEEIANITEYPVVYEGHFEPEFLTLPAEIINSVLIDKQRCFPLLNVPNGLNENGNDKDKEKHLPAFLFVANIRSDNPQRIIRGNEAVVRPRLRDASFFYEKDLQQSLTDNFEKLNNLAFFGGLGSMRQKSERCTDLVKVIAPSVGADPKAAEIAARFCKCDLISLTVQEFPELQGIMGGYYLRGDKHTERFAAGKSKETKEAAAAAIAEHYLPQQSGDPIPAGAEGRALALADKLDSLVGLFARGYKPAGDKDPFGLRRLALGVVRIILESALYVDLRGLLLAAAEGYKKQNQMEISAEVGEEVLRFVNERVNAYAKDAKSAVIAAVFDEPQTDLTDSWLRVRSLTNIPEARREALVALDKRLKNILGGVKHLPQKEIDATLILEPAERALYKGYLELHADYVAAAQARDYDNCCKILAKLSDLLEQFFNEVMVMAEDDRLKNNRLQLLYRIRDPFVRLGNLSKLQAVGKTTDK